MPVRKKNIVPSLKIPDLRYTMDHFINSETPKEQKVLLVIRIGSDYTR